MVFFIPSVILNPIYLLFLLLSIAVNSGLNWLDLECPEIIFWVIAVPGFLYWWWFLGGIAARRLGRQGA